MSTGTVTAPQQRTIVHDDGQCSNFMDTAKWEQIQRVSRAIAMQSLCPKHLQGGTPDQTTANVTRVVNQAIRWQCDPFALVDATYVVSGKLGYEGKLVAAIVNRHANLVGRLRYEFTGTGHNRTVTVRGRFVGEDEDREISLSVAQAKTANKMWETDPDQKLVYSGATKWARRHCPEILLGVLSDDDLDRMSDAPAPLIAGETRSAKLVSVLTASPKVESSIATVATDSDPTFTALQQMLDAIAVAPAEDLPGLRGDVATDDRLSPADKTACEAAIKAREAELKKK